MSYGIKVWNADGSLQFDSTRRLGRILGTLNVVAGSSGTFTVPTNYGTGTIFAFPIENTTTSHFFSGVCDVWVTGNSVVNWNWQPSDFRATRDSIILYGVY